MMTISVVALHMRRALTITTSSMEMSVCWKYGVIFFNSFVPLGLIFSTNIPTALQNEIMNNPVSYSRSNDTSNQTDCKVCLGLGEVRYNLLFSTMRWTSAILCLPSGYMIDRLGNSRSVILLSAMMLLSSVLFTLGAIAHAPTTVPMYLLMLAGRVILAVGDGTLRPIQARVIVHCFPGATFVPIAFAALAEVGQTLSYYVMPTMATVVGFRAAIWLGVGACGFSFLCAVGLVLHLQKQEPREADGYEQTKISTLSDIRALPPTFWLFIWTMAFIYSPWIAKQANLPEYLKLLHGYKMTDAGYITGVPSIVMMSAPLICLLLRKIDCNAVVLMGALILMTFTYVLLGFCPAIQPIILAIADGIGQTLTSVIMWQLLVIISPASAVGTLGGLLYLVRHVTAAFIFLAAGYILEKPELTGGTDTLHSYQHFFLMLIIITSLSVVGVVVMNILDIRETCALNARIGRWRKSDMESTELMSRIQPSCKYS